MGNNAFTPKVGKRRGHTYCNYAQMGASVCLCVSDVWETNRDACFFGHVYFDHYYYLNVVEFEAVVVFVVAVGIVDVAGFVVAVGAAVSAALGNVVVVVAVAVAVVVIFAEIASD